MAEIERFKKFVQADQSGCWNWTGSRDRDGYGLVHFQGKTWLAHRAALMPISRLDNTMIGLSPPACNARKTRCEKGHPFDDANTYRHGRRRQCRKCNAAAVARYKKARSK